MVWWLQYDALSIHKASHCREYFEADNGNIYSKKCQTTKVGVKPSNNYHEHTDQETSSKIGDSLRKCCETSPTYNISSAHRFETGVYALTKPDNEPLLLMATSQLEIKFLLLPF